eukprot:CAMPEP_0194572044 /NCGR_PEP_ID=MMETSP0292-20121207/8785_1 /TAXON_ID=39354 /ORGANISM="Heterosigma akashiwo, Strain CCMP2393" /LENGTH=62 /DNA_ID=CAMNT_0039422951 /DNA_START=301 /DNA_END=485 /DNA_ORIENTATION=+
MASATAAGSDDGNPGGSDPGGIPGNPGGAPLGSPRPPWGGMPLGKNPWGGPLPPGKGGRGGG